MRTYIVPSALRGLIPREVGRTCTALKVAADELLGLKAVNDNTSPRTARLMKRLGRVAELPAADQRAMLKLIDALIEARARTSGASSTRKAS